MTHQLAPIIIKRDSLTETGQFTGYVSTWDGEPDSQGDIIRRGAFTRALSLHMKNGTMPALLWNHDTNEPVGRWLNLTEDKNGLLGTGKLTLGTKRGAEAYELIKDDAIALSIGFTLAQNGATRNGNIRTITSIARLHEVSLVASPANSHAKILEVKTSPRIFEKALREKLGLSAREAKRATAGGWRGLVRDEQNALELVLDRIEELQNTIESRMR